MPDKKTQRIRITFDRKVLRTKYSLPTYREARRYSTPIYSALINELLEDGYLLTAKYFTQECEKEHKYYIEHVIDKRLQDMPELLLDIYDKCRMAEQFAKENGDLTSVANLLYQILLLLQSRPYRIPLKWLLEDVFQIVINISDKWLLEKVHPNDQICRIYFTYAVYLIRANNYEKAICYFHSAFEMAKGEQWLYDAGKAGSSCHENLFHAIADAYLEGLFDYFTHIVYKDLERARQLVDRAVVISNAAHVAKSVPSIVKNLCQVSAMNSEKKNFPIAKIVLKKLEKFLKQSDQQHKRFLLLNFYLARGVYYSESEQFDVAMECLAGALNLAKALNDCTYEGRVLICMGNSFLGMGSHETRSAIKCYKRAGEIFHRLGNELFRRRCVCKISKVMLNRLLPMILQLIKSKDTYCHFFYLRRWKTQLTPFWLGANNVLISPPKDDIQCLLKSQ